MSDLYDDLREYTSGTIYPMHMPGHKRNPSFAMVNPYAIDVTEVEGTDNLHHPTGIIKKEKDRLKKIYRTEDTELLVNGSTCGLLTAISACCRRGERILLARNCHGAVYHAVCLLELEPYYLYPETDKETGICLGITGEQVRAALEDKEVSCVVITSPTYEGVLSPIREIADITHERGIPLVVDEAHGAHLEWSDAMPESAVRQGADLVVQSLHKTLPALTQTALLHRVTNRISAEKIANYLSIYETSSPSYVLLSSISQCITWLETRGREAFACYEQRRRRFCEMAKEWKHLVLWETEHKDPTKLVIATGDSALTGRELGDLLRRRYGIEVEMEAAGYLIAMTSIADSEAGFERLAEALAAIDGTLETAPGETRELRMPDAVVKRKSYEALNEIYETIPLSESVGRIAAEYCRIYPPGIPFLVPGEEITQAVIDRIRQGLQCRLNVQGMADESGQTIRVLAEREVG